jgi:2-methylcitrate dehydratase PrpD
MVSRIAVEERSDLAMGRNDAVPAEVEIRLKDGRTERKVVHVPSGDPRNPMSEQERRVKFLDCVSEVLPDRADAWAGLQSLRENAPIAKVFGRLRGESLPPVASYG